MRHAVERASGGMMYIPTFIKFGSCVPELLRRKRMNTDRLKGEQAYFHFLRVRKVDSKY
jgi:hypothetical protein